MEPDQIVQSGIRTLQQKIGGLLKALDPRKYGGDEDNAHDGPRSPDMNMDGGTTPWGQAEGYQSAYGGGQTAYGGGQTAYGSGSGSGTSYGGGTAYGQTPYGQSGWQ